MNAAIRAAMGELDKAGVFYVTANKGVHVMVSLNGRRIDFWPTSGKWIRRGFRDQSGQGLDSLLELIQSEKDAIA